MYDYLVVGAGLCGSVFAHEAAKAGKKVLIIDKRGNIAGNVYTRKMEGINVHVYGAHIFHTNNKVVWEYLSQFAALANPISAGQMNGTASNCARQL